MFGYPLWRAFPIACPFHHIKPVIMEIINSIENMNLALRNSNPLKLTTFFLSIYFIAKLQSTCLWKCWRNSFRLFCIWIIFCSKLWVFENYIEAFTLNTSEAWIVIMELLQYIDDFYSSSLDEIDKYSQSAIDNQMAVIAAALIIFIFSSFAVYFGFYLQFFRNEKKYMRKINSILKIMPSKK
ncbi:unnamed protein product [Blepharisma stoltei]|uniref:Uncharacterized protein n=1 Tax=Blepharisma stoltei TaxID=1481888 RepID=A0AAU9IAC8_9CILI|nr:unnamed protein product [Blepharisma stoltei]